MIITKTVNGNYDLYRLEIDTAKNTNYSGMTATLFSQYSGHREHPLIQQTVRINDYIRIAKEIVTEYENASTSELKKFNDWGGDCRIKEDK